MLSAQQWKECECWQVDWWLEMLFSWKHVDLNILHTCSLGHISSLASIFTYTPINDGGPFLSLWILNILYFVYHNTAYLVIVRNLSATPGGYKKDIITDIEVQHARIPNIKSMCRGLMTVVMKESRISLIEKVWSNWKLCPNIIHTRSPFFPVTLH